MSTSSTSAGSWTSPGPSSTHSSTRGHVIESHDLGDAGLKEIRLLLEWKLPLHLVYVVNEREKLVIYRTFYVPDAAHWQPGYRERRRP